MNPGKLLRVLIKTGFLIMDKIEEYRKYQAAGGSCRYQYWLENIAIEIETDCLYTAIVEESKKHNNS